MLSFLALLRYLGNTGALSAEGSIFVALENQFGKNSSSKIIRDIKAVSDQTHMQLMTVAGRELASAYEMGDIVYSLYRSRQRLVIYDANNWHAKRVCWVFLARCLQMPKK